MGFPEKISFFEATLDDTHAVCRVATREAKRFVGRAAEPSLEIGRIIQENGHALMVDAGCKSVRFRGHEREYVLVDDVAVLSNWSLVMRPDARERKKRSFTLTGQGEPMPSCGLRALGLAV